MYFFKKDVPILAEKLTNGIVSSHKEKDVCGSTVYTFCDKDKKDVDLRTTIGQVDMVTIHDKASCNSISIEVFRKSLELFRKQQDIRVAKLHKKGGFSTIISIPNMDCVVIKFNYYNNDGSALKPMSILDMVAIKSPYERMHMFQQMVYGFDKAYRAIKRDPIYAELLSDLLDSLISLSKSKCEIELLTEFINLLNETDAILGRCCIEDLIDNNKIEKEKGMSLIHSYQQYSKY